MSKKVIDIRKFKSKNKKQYTLEELRRKVEIARDLVVDLETKFDYANKSFIELEEKYRKLVISTKSYRPISELKTIIQSKEATKFPYYMFYIVYNLDDEIVATSINSNNFQVRVDAANYMTILYLPSYYIMYEENMIGYFDFNFITEFGEMYEYEPTK